MKSTRVSPRTSPFAIHHGPALLSLSVNYPHLLDVIMEAIQNAIDANATRIWVTFNQKSRHLTVSDNGDGRSRSEFEKALVNVCSSIKPKGKLGRFGIGLMAPFGKCERFTFTSTTRGKDRDYIEWEFVTADLRSQKTIEGIPMKFREDLVFGNRTPGRGKTAIPWRTQLRLESFTKDRIISRVGMSQLKEAILERYGPTMRRLNAIVSVRIREVDAKDELCQDIQAEPFSGQKLEEVVIPDRNAGNNVFRLYLATGALKARRGRVFVGEVNDEFRLAFSTFVHSAGKWLDSEAVEALSSGVFEGEILTTNAELHANRKGFLEDERLEGFCGAIGAWYKAGGRALFQEAKDERQEQRYQELSLRALEGMEDLLRREQLAELQLVLNSFKIGSVGPGHVKPKPTRIIGLQNLTGVALDGVREPSPESTRERSGRVKGEPKEAKPDHHPYIATGPRGKRRTEVRSDSLGLTFVQELMSDEEKAWELDAATGELRFNTRHALWELCETSDRALVRYMQAVAIIALVHHGLPQEWSSTDYPRLAFNELLPPFTYMLRFSDDLVRVKPPQAAKPSSKKRSH